MSVPNTVDVATVDVAIIGGGIAGLSAAWYIQQKAQEQGAPIRYALLESAPHWGGKIVTEEVSVEGHSPFIVEGGPDSFITQKTWALQLARELGLQEELLSTNDGIALRKANVSISLRGATTVATDAAQIVLMEQDLSHLIKLLDLAEEFRQTMKVGFWTTIVPGAVCIGGVFFLHFGIYAGIALYNLGLLAGLTTAMTPLWRHRGGQSCGTVK